MVDKVSDYDDFLLHINDILSSFGDGHTLGEDSDLVNELGLSSLQVMELIEQVEDRFDVSIPLNALPEIRTAGDLAQQLARMIR